MAWWFNLNTQQVEEGDGDPNAERFGPYATREEAEAAVPGQPLDRSFGRAEQSYEVIEVPIEE